jgi:hypothetical protein
MIRLFFAATLTLGVGAGAFAADKPNLVLEVPSSTSPLHVAVDLPDDFEAGAFNAWNLVEQDGGKAGVLAQLAPAMSPDGLIAKAANRLVAVIPPAEKAAGTRRFRLDGWNVNGVPKSPFAFSDPTKSAVTLTENNKHVYTYQRDTIVNESVPRTDSRRTRACFIHPLFGLKGEELTDSFPRDHFHHHGIFWAWKTVEIEGVKYEHWEQRSVKTKFVDWLGETTGQTAGSLAVENGWFVGDAKVMIERVWVRTFASDENARVLDIDLVLIPTDKPVSLQGAGGKSYGGMTMRFKVWPNKEADVAVTVPQGVRKHVGDGLLSKEDLSNTRLPYADLTANFSDAPGRSGATLMISPDHPDYPPTWLTRCYGPLCVGWPGVEAQTLPAGKPVKLSYRVWVHRNEESPDTIAAAYEAYEAAKKAKWVD